MKIIRDRTSRLHVEYRDEYILKGCKDRSGFSFPVMYPASELVPCDSSQFEDWKEVSASECSWWENYRTVKNDPNYEYERVRKEWPITEPAVGICVCGMEVELVNQYMGACQCECGRWYNLFGQRLIDPKYWEE